MPQPEPQHVIADYAVIENKTIISPAHLVIEGERIVKIHSTVQSLPPSATILKNHVLLPGFTNAHCHLELTSIGPLVKNTFFKWVRELIKKKSLLTEMDFSDAIRQGAQTLLESGVTTVIDHASPTTPVAAYRNLPVNVIVFAELAGLTPEILDTTTRDLAIQKKSSLVPHHISPHSVYALDPDTLRDFLNTREHPLSIHISESEDEMQYFRHGRGDLGMRIVELTGRKTHQGLSGYEFLRNTGADLENILFVHGNFLSKEELDEIAFMKNICVVHCPGSFEFFGHKRFPFDEMKKRGIPVALGTDSLASNSSFNYLDEVNRFLKKYPETDFFELLPMLTTNALAAIGITDRGAISEGMAADLTGWRVQDGFEWKNFFSGRTRADFVMGKGQIHLASGLSG